MTLSRAQFLLVDVAAAQTHSDRDVLAELHALEAEASLVYGTLRGGAGVPGRLFRSQSREHARGLEELLRQRGGRPRLPVAAEATEYTTAGVLAGVRPRGGRPRPPRARAGPATPEQALALEERTMKAYYRALGELRDERLLAPLAAAMANHGQHAVVLREALARDPLPDAFAGLGPS